MDELESKLKEKLGKLNSDSFEQWLQHPATKALKLQIQLDGEQLKDCWAKGQFGKKTEQRQQGRAGYIDEIENLIRNLWSVPLPEEEEEDEG